MGKPLHYKGCTLHRIIPQFMCQVLFHFLVNKIGRWLHSWKWPWRRVYLRRTLCRRELHTETHRSWIAFHGELWSEYERIAVLYYHSALSVAGWTPCGVWRGEEGDECTEDFGNVWYGERNADVWIDKMSEVVGRRLPLRIVVNSKRRFWLFVLNDFSMQYVVPTTWLTITAIWFENDIINRSACVVQIEFS